MASGWGPVTPGAGNSDFQNAFAGKFSIDNLLSVDETGDKSIRKFGEARDAARSAPDVAVRRRQFRDRNMEKLPPGRPAMAESVPSYQNVGGAPNYRGMTHSGMRVRGAPYKESGANHLLESLCRDDQRGVRLLAPTKAIGPVCPVLCSPATPDSPTYLSGEVSIDRRLIWEVVW